MAIIPIQIEGQKTPSNRFSVDRRGSIDRRGSLARIGAADPLSRRGSYARILADVSNRRRGSAAKINPISVNGGVASNNGYNGDRRDSYAQINIDLGLRRGSLARRESKQDMKRKNSLSKAYGGDDGTAGSRRGSIVNGGAMTARRGSDARIDSLLLRRGSGQVGRTMSRRGSRAQVKSFQVKIRMEGEDEGAKENKSPPSNNNNPPANLKSRLGEKNKNTSNKSNMVAKKKETKDISPPGKKPVSPRWQNVDREVVQYRGGDNAGIEVQPINTRSRITPQSATKKVEPSLPVCSPEFLAQFAQEALDQHNKYRAIHGVKPLVLDTKLSQHAQKYAQHLAKTSTFEHSDDPDYGENLYWSWSSDPNFKVKGHESVDSWYEECLQNYDYSREPRDTESGHFTQLVWDTTTRLGVGLAKSSTGRNVVVMKYDPPGNYVGQYTKHVHKPCTQNNA